MAVNALRDDLFSIIDAFASPRQGAKDNVALLALEEQEKQAAPPPSQPPQVAEAGGTGVGPGMSYPGTVSDAAPEPLPFVPPTPVSSKPIQIAAAGAPAAAVAAAPPPAPQPAVVPPVPPPPPPPGASGFSGGPAAPPGPAPAPVDPTGGIDVFKIWQQQADAARRAQAIERIADGGTLMAAALTKSPSMRAALAGAAKGGGGGGGGGRGAGDLSFDQLTKLQESSVSAAQRQSLLGQLPAISKQTGISPERLRIMADTDPKQIAQLVDAVSRPDLHVAENTDGTFRVFSKNNPEQTIRTIGSADPAKVADIERKAAGEQRAAEAHPLEQGKRAGDILKTEQETIKFKDENERSATLKAYVADPARRKEIADQMGVPETMVETLLAGGKLDESVQKIAEGTDDWREYLKTDRKMSPTEWFKYQTEKRSTQISPFNEVAQKDIKDTMTKIDVADKTLKDQLPIAQQKSRMIREGRGMYGQAFGSDRFKEAAGYWVDLFGGDASRVSDTQTLGSMIKLQMVSRAKELGTQPTNYDEKLLMDALGGNTQNTRQAALEMARAEVRFGLRSMLEANHAIERSVKNYGDRDPDSARILKSRMRDVPDYTEDAFKPSELNAFLNAVKSEPDKREQIMKEWDRDYGEGVAAYVLAKRGGA